jgi:general secretion pathway protein D
MKWVSKNPKRTLMVLLFIIPLVYQSGCAGNKNLRLGQEYASAGDWDNSVQAFQDALEESPQDQEIQILLVRSKKNASIDHLAKGESLLENKRYDEALTELQMALTFDSSNLKAESTLEKTRRMKESDYYLKKGFDLEKTQSYTKAKESFQKALELSKENEAAQKALDRYIETDPDARQKKYPLKVGKETPISLKFKTTPILNVFEVLTKLVGVNFIFDKDIKETKVTFFLSNVSFDQFMSIFLQTNQLAATVVNENTMIIYPDTAEKAKEYQDLQIRTFYLANLDVKKAVELLNKILNSKDISANESMNALVIRGAKDKLDIASKILEANDRPPAEATFNVEILEVSRAKEKQIGLELSPPSVSVSVGNASPDFFTPGSDTAPESGGASLNTLGKASDENILLSIPTATLNLLKRDGDTKTLAKPQIRVKNNEEAKIHIGERIPLRTNRRTDTTGAVTYDYQYQDVGVKLTVKPSINLHDEITMTLNLEISSIGSNVGTVSDPQYSIKTRSAQSILSVRAGESVIIGGLIADDERKTVQKVPLLGDIPAVGYLFSSYDTSNIQTDILMAITPIIVRSQEIPSQEVTRIWSGKEENMSSERPYEDIAGMDEAMLDIPKESIKEDLMIQQEKTSVEDKIESKPSEGTVIDNEDSDEDPPPDEISQQDGIDKGPDNRESSEISETGRSVDVIGANQTPHEKVPEGSAEKSAPAVQKTDISSASWPVALPYSIQVNSYDNEIDAGKRLETLKQMEYDCFIYSVYLPEKGRTYYRVFVGRYQDLKSAEKACEELRKKGDFERDIYVAPRSWAIGG